MINTLHQIFKLLLPHERKRFYWILGVMLCMAVVDVIGIASIMPFIAIVVDPSGIAHHKTIAALYHTGHFTSQNRFLVFLGCSVFTLLLFSNSIALLSTWLISNFTQFCEYTLSSRLLQVYLQKNYIFYVLNNTSELAKNILLEVNGVVSGVIIPATKLIAKSLITLLILSLVIIIDPILAFSLVVLIGGSYALIYGYAKYKLARLGEYDVMANTDRFKICAEALQGIKDYKLRGKEENVLRRYAVITHKLVKARANSEAIIHLPHFALEALAFGAILLIIVYLLLTQHRISDTIPLLGVYVFACYRFMPALQQIFISVTSIRLRGKAVNTLFYELQHYQPFTARDESNKLPLKQQLELNQVYFNYPRSGKAAITNISLTIASNKTIGFIGASGAGKTTVADLILGLLSPASGEIRIDGVLLTENNVAQWQNNIGYVAQNFFLLDTSIAGNIAFGLLENEIDMQKVIEAAQLANIHHFVMQELDQQYNTIIGERGIRLSGGQRQRIAIARALYHNPGILILDEATSALDNQTENAILDAIQQLSHQKTIIIIAHRLSTIKMCDEIFLFSEGAVVDQGNYPYLLQHSSTFRKFAQLENNQSLSNEITVN